ncbi:sensor histidine kinase [Massilia sp. TSP1-1-2]|uniref:sensor histidine kinase n=1 Tax=unclassified Massilia TaxID=2609279 RepID=UPI003CF87ABE
MEVILQEWEDFAETLYPVTSASKAELRDHAKEMLKVICIDLDTAQATQVGIEKSQGLAPADEAETAAQSHAEDRLLSGFSIEQLMAEYRAVRASVLRLWQEKMQKADELDLQDMLRFNEAIDQSLTEAIARYSAMLRDSQHIFLSILGHDVRNPLGAISMGTQLIMQDEALPQKHQRVASQVLKSAQRVSEIVADLLDFSTSHLGGGIPVTAAPMDFRVECETVVDEMRIFHPGRMFELAMHGDLHVHWDRARIAQALSNLVANAVQHGAATEPVWITISREQSDVVWVVQNAGAVIAPARLRTMFDPVKTFSIKSASERSASQTHNLGLGLYITHEIATAHGGKIRVTSTPSHGTTFTLRIPANAVPAASAHARLTGNA